MKLKVVRTYIQSTNYSELYDCLERNVVHEIQVKLFHAQQYKTNIIEQKFIISWWTVIYAVWIVWELRLQIGWIWADLECERLG